MGALTPALLLLAPGQVSLITDHALPDIQSPPTPCAPVPAMLLAPDRLRLRFALAASGGSSDFVHCSRSRQSHQAVSSLYRGPLIDPSVLQAVCSLPVALHLTSRWRSYFPFLAGSSATEGLPPSCACSLSSARARPSRSHQSASRGLVRMGV